MTNKLHLVGHDDSLDPWCGTPAGAVTADWALVTCGRCSKEVARRTAAARRTVIGERRSAQGTLIDPDHPAARPPNVIDFAEYARTHPQRDRPKRRRGAAR